MEILKKPCKIIIIIAFLSQICFAEGETELLDKKIELFEIKDASIGQVIHELARPHKVPLCLETVPSKWDEIERGVLSFKLQETILREVLDALIKRDNRYSWKENNNIINIIPVVLRDDNKYIMNQKISEFVVKNATESDAIDSLFLLPEIQRSNLVMMEEGRLMSTNIALRLRTHTFSLNLQDITVREVLNAIAKAEGNAYWILTNIETDKGIEHNLGFWYW